MDAEPKNPTTPRLVALSLALLTTISLLASIVLWARLGKLTADFEEQKTMTVAQSAEIDNTRQTSEKLNGVVAAISLLLEDHEDRLSKGTEFIEESLGESAAASSQKKDTLEKLEKKLISIAALVEELNNNQTRLDDAAADEKWETNMKWYHGLPPEK
jgi:hypothetical protein